MLIYQSTQRYCISIFPSVRSNNILIKQKRPGFLTRPHSHILQLAHLQIILCSAIKARSAIGKDDPHLAVFCDVEHLAKLAFVHAALADDLSADCQNLIHFKYLRSFTVIDTRFACDNHRKLSLSLIIVYHTFL